MRTLEVSENAILNKKEVKEFSIAGLEPLTSTFRVRASPDVATQLADVIGGMRPILYTFIMSCRFFYLMPNFSTSGIIL